MSDDKSKDIKIEESAEERSIILKHLNRWKSFYEILLVVIAVGLSAWANVTTMKSLNKQELEFRIRNRPYVILDGDPKLGGDVKYSFETKQGEKHLREYGESFEKSIEINIQNASDVPAKQFKGIAVIYLNNKQVYRTAIVPITFTLVKGSSRRFSIGLKDEWWNTVSDNSKELSIDLSLTYTGMLGEVPDSYQTIVRFILEVDVEKKSYKCLYTEYDIK